MSGSGVDRQNATLDRIYQSKVYGGARNGINTQAVGFAAASDINAGASSNAAVDLVNGLVAPTISAGSLSNVLSDAERERDGSKQHAISHCHPGRFSGKRFRGQYDPPYPHSADDWKQSRTFPRCGLAIKE